MTLYICSNCNKSYRNYQELQHIDSILETGICCECREDAAFCTECNMFYFDEEAYLIEENESELCTIHYQRFFEKEKDEKRMDMDWIDARM